MRNHDNPESLVIIASASDLLLRATDGMLVDGEACTLPQLELLEATTRAVQLVLKWGDSGSTIMEGLANMLKCRLPATTHCLSHPSAHVRTLSTSVLRDLLLIGSAKSTSKQEDIKAINGPPIRYSSLKIIDFHADMEKCLTWEAQNRHAKGMTIIFLDAASKELGFTLPI